MKFEHAKWIAVPHSEIENCQILDGDMTGRFAYFTCIFEAKQGEKREIAITASSRYRLWCNGVAIASGPCKGSKEEQFYDELVLTNLQDGENLLAVQVLYQDVEGCFDPLSNRAGIFGVDAPRVGHRLAVEGEGVTTGEAVYRCYLDGSFYLKKPKVLEFLGAIQEEIDFGALPETWKRSVETSKCWPESEVLFSAAPNPFLARVGMRNSVPYNERPIPLLKEDAATFEKVLLLELPANNADGVSELSPESQQKNEGNDGSDSENENGVENGEGTYEDLAFGRVIRPEDFGELTDQIVIPAEESKYLLFDAKVHTNAYMRWAFVGGKGRKIEITYAEDLTEAHDALRAGLTDTIVLADHETIYEPFWYRTFRYVVVKVLPGESAVTLQQPTFHKTGFPIDVKTTIKSSAPWVEQVWDLCVRTLENCMMDTYMDCPFYEQMQYPMDTRLQAAFTYAVSADPRLPKKALYDFHRAMTPDGLIPGKAPTGYMQVISTFSLHYIMMLYDYYMQTGETDILHELRADVDGMLEYFAAHIRKEDGLMGHPGYWAFVDWQDAWEENAGVPTALNEGGSALISLLYGYTLLCAAEIMEATGRPALAEEYRTRQQSIAAAVDATCWDADRKMYREGPGYLQFSQHTQSWAVLNGLKSGAEAAELLRRTVEDADVLKCSFSTSNEFFRACQEAGAYELTDTAMEQWRQLPKKGLTTCPETPNNARSLCHAWSALPIYEMVHAMAGITCTKPGWEEIVIQPHLVGVQDLEGEAATPVGKIRFRYEKQENGALQCELEIPEGANCSLQKVDGSRMLLETGANHITI